MIRPIFSSNITYKNNTSVKQKNGAAQVSFKAHPEYEYLSKNFQLTASGFFRRGREFGTPDEEFIDIVKLMNAIFKRNSFTKKKMLVIGVGSSQEPFSDLAVIKRAINGTPIKKRVELHTIDLQPKPNEQKLFIDSFYDSPKYPRFAGESFVYDKEHEGLFQGCHYRVDDEIFDFVKRTYNNPFRSRWDARVQDVIKEYSDDKFDIVAVNNTLPYIGETGTIVETLQHIKRILKPRNGYLITDPYKLKYMREPGVLDNLQEEEKGIYRKLQ